MPTAGGRPQTNVQAGQRPSAKLTSALSGPSAVGKRPAAGAGSPTSLTTKTSGVSRPAISKSPARSGGSSGIANKLTSAIAGAGLGVAGKMAYDKIFGKAPSPNDGSYERAEAARLKRLGENLPGKVPASVVKPPVVPPKAPVIPPKTSGGTRPTVPKAPVTIRPTIPKAPVTGGPKAPPIVPKAPVKPKPPVTTPTGGSKVPDSGGSGPITNEDGSIRNEDGSITNADGSTTYTYDDGSTITIGADGSVVSSEEATDVGGGSEEIVNEDGSTTYTYDDGSSITVDAEGNVTGQTDALEDEADDGSTTYTYDDGSTMTVDASGNVIGQTDASGEEVAQETIGESEDGFFQDESGNVYDSEGNLVSEADTSDSVYTDEYGNQYNYDGELISEAAPEVKEEFELGDNNYYEGETTDSTEYAGDSYDYSDDYYDYDYDYYGDSDYAKNGGLITMMKQGGGVRNFVDGGYSDTTEEVQDYQNVGYNYGEYDDPTMTGYTLTGNTNPVGNTYRNFTDDLDAPIALESMPVNSVSVGSGNVIDTEMFDDGSYIEYMDDGTSVTYDSDGNVYESGDLAASNSRTETFDDGSTVTYDANGDVVGYTEAPDEAGNRTETFDDGSSITYDANGNVVGYTETPDETGNRTQVFDDGSSITYDAQGNVVDYTESPDASITSAGSGVKDIYRPSPVQTGADIAQDKVEELKQKNALQKMLEGITGSEYLGAGAAGAVLGALLGDSSLFGGSGTDRQAIDMTKVGNIAPRTTDFGVGAPRYVTYDQYGARDQMPDLYGNELYQNLNAPGFNPVSEGDYDVAQEEPAEETPAVPKMAAGGLTDTYYTYGKAVDPLENLRNPQPMQSGQPEMPQGAAPMMPQGAQQGMPQGMPRPAPQGGLGGLPQGGQPGMPMPSGMPPQMPMGQSGMPQGMRSGGLPALSNVPFKEGRLDFRQGSAVHGPGDGQSDDIPAMLADGEYVIDAETVAQIGNGSTKAGAKALDSFRESIRAHKRAAPLNKIPPKTKALTSYLKKGK